MTSYFRQPEHYNNPLEILAVYFKGNDCHYPLRGKAVGN